MSLAPPGLLAQRSLRNLNRWKSQKHGQMMTLHRGWRVSERLREALQESILRSSDSQRHRKRCLLYQYSVKTNSREPRCRFTSSFLMERMRMLRRDWASSQRDLRRLTCLSMRQRPTSVLLRFICYYSTSENRPHYKPMNLADQRFRCVFICQMDVDA